MIPVSLKPTKNQMSSHLRKRDSAFKKCLSRKSFRTEGKCLFKCISRAFVSVTSLIFLWLLAISIRKWQNSLHGLQGPLNLGIIGIDLVGSRPSAFWIRCAVVPLSAWWFTADCLLCGWCIAKKHLTMFDKHCNTVYLLGWVLMYLYCWDVAS